MNIDFDAIIQFALPALARLTLVVFSTLGVVYMAGRLLFPKMKDRSKNVLAFFCLIMFAFFYTLVFDFPKIIESNFTIFVWQYYAYSVAYATVGAVFYIIVGWRFYSRMDSLLDHKMGKDNRRKK